MVFLITSPKLGCLTTSALLFHVTSLFLFFSVGKAIHIDAISDPSIEDIDHLHELYIEGLKDIFETYKTEFGIAEDQHLEII